MQLSRCDEKGKLTSMTMALVVWMCSLPLIFVIVAPLLGAQVAGLAAAGLFIALLFACLAICTGSYMIARSPDEGREKW